MGSFSWMYADDGGDIANVYYGAPFKLLIPKEFGGGFIADKSYQDYGYLDYKANHQPKYDMYELLAIWNTEGEKLPSETPYEWLKEIDRYTNKNRLIGVDMAFSETFTCKYPLKLVTMDFKGCYEDVEASPGDPEQGFVPISRESIKCPW